jgi:hypothetical protein
MEQNAISMILNMLANLITNLSYKWHTTLDYPTSHPNVGCVLCNCKGGVGGLLRLNTPNPLIS